MKSNLGIAVLIFLISCKTSQNIDNPSFQQSSFEVDSVMVSKWPDYRASYSRSFDLLHTRLNLRFDWENRLVIGEADLYLKPYYYETSMLMLDAKEFDLNEISLYEQEDTIPLKYEYDSGQVWIDLNRTLNKNDTVMLHIAYTANPNRNTGFDDKGLYFINPDGINRYKPRQIWTHGEPEYNSRWFPTIDAPNERCTQEVFLTVQQDLRTISNGSLVWSRVNPDGTRTDYWNQELPHAPYLFMVAVGPFVAVQDSHESIPCTIWTEPEYAEDTPYIFRHTGEMMTYFSDLLDYPFPWSKYDQIIVRDFVSRAMENTTASTFMEDLLVRKSFLVDDHWDGIISHELFHQWFGDLVTCESWANLSLNEALASYGEYLWIAHKYGDDEAAWHGMNELVDYLDEATREKHPVIRYFYDKPENLFDQHSYAKGSRVLHMLRSFVGDEAFFAALHHYLKRNEFNSVEIHDFRKSFEHITGEDLNWFFEQWFMRPGHPELSINHLFENDTLYIEVTQIQDLTISPLYYLPLYLELSFVDSVYQYPLQILDEYHLFKLPLKRKPESIVVDGDYVLVGNIIHEKSNQELLDQLRLGGVFQSRYFAIAGLLDRDTLDDFALEAIKLGIDDRSPRIQEFTLSYLSYSANDELQQFAGLVSDLLSSPNSRVRVAALIAAEGLGLLESDQWEPFLNDTSYLVQGIALEYLLSLGNVKSRELYLRFRDNENINLILPIGNYISEFIKEDQISWYLEKLERSMGSDLFYIVQLTANYVLGALDGEKIKVINPLFDLASSHYDPDVRLAAFHGLMAMENMDGIREKLALIRSLESDPELKEIYERF